MKLGHITTRCQYSLIAVLVLASVWSSRARAQDGHGHGSPAQHHEQTPEQKAQAEPSLSLFANRPSASATSR